MGCKDGSQGGGPICEHEVCTYGNRKKPGSMARACNSKLLHSFMFSFFGKRFRGIIYPGPSDPSPLPPKMLRLQGSTIMLGLFGAGDQTQGLIHARQSLHTPSEPRPQPSCCILDVSPLPATVVFAFRSKLSLSGFVR